MKRELAFALGAQSLILDSAGKTRSNRATSAHSNGLSGSRSRKRVKKAAAEEPVEFNCSAVATEDLALRSSAFDEIDQDLTAIGSRNAGLGDFIGHFSIDKSCNEVVFGLANGLLERKCEAKVEIPMLAEAKAFDGSVSQIEESESQINGDIGVEDKDSEKTPFGVKITEAVSGSAKTRCDEEVEATVHVSSILADTLVTHNGIGWSLSNCADGMNDNLKEGNSNVANDSTLQQKSSLIASVLENGMVDRLHETRTDNEVAMEKSSLSKEVTLVNGNLKGLTEKPQRRFTRSALKVTNKYPADLSDKNDLVDVDNKDIGEESNADCTRSDSPQKFEVEDLEQIFAERIPRNVRELFATGILEGCKVYYNGGKQGPGIRGTIKGVGILCSCSLCQGRKVVAPSQFEIHACNSYRRAAQYICFENGKNFIDLLQLCRETDLKTLVATIRNSIGPVGKKEMVVCRDCKESFSMDNVMDKEPLCNSCSKKVLPSEILQTPAGKTRGSQDKVLSKSPTSIQTEEVSEEKAIASGNKKKSSRKTSSPKTAVKTGRKRGRPRKQANDSSKGPSVEGSSQRKTSGKITRKDLKLHRLVFDDAGLPDGTELAYFARGEKILEGYKKDTGIFCRCCDEVVSASQFEAHAGFATRRKPYSFIYTSNGVSLHELAVSLLKSRRRDVKDSDDLCIICAEGGVLLLCDGCPRAFHTECASLTHQPRGKWFCRYCENAFERDKYVERNANAVAAGRVSGVDPIKQISNRSIRMVKDFKDDAITSCCLCSGLDFSRSGFGPRTILICDQCEREYHVGCLKTNNMADLEALPEGEWFCNHNCEMIRSSLQTLLNIEAEKLPDNLVDAIRDKLKANNVEVASNFDVSWRLLSGQVSSEARANTRPLLSEAISILHDGFGTIVDGVTGRDLIPSIVYGRKVRNREFRGMYCAVLLVNSQIASVAVFRLFGQELVELPLVATRSDFRGKGYFQALFGCIERLFASYNVKTIVLPAAEGAEAVWLKFGFKKMNPDQVSKYKKTYWQITEFTGVAMLEKQVSDSGLNTQQENGLESISCA